MYVMFVLMMIFLALVPVTWVQFLFLRKDRLEFFQLWRKMWRWTIGEALPEGERPGIVLLSALSALAATAVIIAIKFLL